MPSKIIYKTKIYSNKEHPFSMSSWVNKKYANMVKHRGGFMPNNGAIWLCDGAMRNLFGLRHNGSSYELILQKAKPKSHHHEFYVSNQQDYNIDWCLHRVDKNIKYDGRIADCVGYHLRHLVQSGKLKYKERFYVRVREIKE